MKNKNWKIRIGVGLMIVSIPFFLIIPAFPFLEIENSKIVIWSTTSLIIGEVLFWSGGLLLGKELFTKYKSYFNPKNWFKKNREEEVNSEER